MKPVLLLEINEIPWRLIDRYVDDPAYPHLRQFMCAAEQYTTVTVDSGELSPWVTWPTLHRGMSSDHHHIRYLGQDPSTFAGKPIWDEVTERGGSVGVFGSLQSWPPKPPGQNGFYVPDTFAHDEQCFPAWASSLQRLNLGMVRKNGRVVSAGLPALQDGLGAMFAFLRARPNVRSIAMLVKQLVGERFDSSLVARRPIFQTVIFWELFKHLFDPRNPPALTTFFTNHVASVMHRHWHAAFPEDFVGRRIPEGPSQEPLMRFALSVLDNMLKEVLAWRRINPDLTVVFASSMGQGATYNDGHEGFELVVEDVDKLMVAAELDGKDYRPLLAMVPQVAVDIPDDEKRRRAAEILAGATLADERSFIDVSEVGTSLSITVATPSKRSLEAGKVKFGSRAIQITEAGIRMQPVEAGTGYHIPEGSFAVLKSGNVHDANTGARKSRPSIPADQVKPMLLGYCAAAS